MASKKIKDIAVKVGEYTDRNTGENKNRYQNVGALMKSDDGSVFILLQRTFNPAGINSDRETVLLSCFDLRDQDGGQRQAPAERPAANRGGAGPDDEIPF